MAVWLRAKVITVAILSAGAFSSGCVSPLTHTPLEITPSIYQGCQPTTPADFATLHRRGIRTILSLEVLISHVQPERKLARQDGFAFLNVPILPSPLPPSQRQVKKAILTLHNPSLWPIFVHCYIGDDRTTFITGLYRIYYLGWTPEAAWQAMLREGFHPRWWLYGFKTYFWRHTQIPEWARTQQPSTSEQGRAAAREKTQGWSQTAAGPGGQSAPVEPQR